jgi:hypothetical protein
VTHHDRGVHQRRDLGKAGDAGEDGPGQVRGGELDTFSIGFEEQGYDVPA